VWVKGIVYAFERSFFVSALEAATAMLMEVEFGWSTESIGLAIGVMFLASLPLTLAANKVRGQEWVTDLSLMCGCSCACMVASLFFFPDLAAFLALGTRGSIGLILTADCIIFSSGFLSNGVMDGFAVKSSMKGTLYTPEAYVVASNVAISLSRFVGPILGRTALSMGRTLYACCQLWVSGLGCLTCLSVAATMRHGAYSRKA